MPTVKRCTKCGIEKPLSEFPKNKNRPDGRNYWCKECARNHRNQHAEERKAYARKYRKEHAEELSEYNKQWRADNPGYSTEYRKQWCADNPERCRELRTQYYQKHRKKELEYANQYRLENPDKVKAAQKRWSDNNPDKQRANCQRRRARKAITVCDLTPEQSDAILSTGCFFCGSMDNLTLAHDTPVVRGGNTTPGNIFCLCRSCNSSMGTKTLSETIGQLVFDGLPSQHEAGI